MQTPRALRQLHMENVRKNSTPLKIPASPFMKSLGYGTGVNVFRLERSPKCGEGRSPLAVKRVSQRARQTGDGVIFDQRIMVEAEILRKLSHPNIVGFRGVAKAKDGVSSLALECCKTSLGDILEDRKENKLGPLPAKLTLKMILDISSALDYLHTDAKLLHGDLKSYNVLVKGDFEICKLCDFGVSLPMDENGMIDFRKNSHMYYVGTSCWTAPEVIDGSDVIDCKADIFSFGLVIYETLALVAPHTLDITKSEDYSIRNTSVDDSLMNNTQQSASAPQNHLVDSKDKENAAECSVEIASMNTSDNTDASINGTDMADDIEPYGTRPPLPQAFDLSNEYNCIVELFCCCTNEFPEDRPLAKVIWQSVQPKVADHK